MNVPDWSDVVTMQDAAAATGNGNDLLTNNFGGAGVAISGTFAGTVTFEGSSDGVNYFAVPATNRTSGTGATTATAPGLFFVALQGISRLRARVSAYTSGNVTVKGVAVPIYSTL